MYIKKQILQQYFLLMRIIFCDLQDNNNHLTTVSKKSVRFSTARPQVAYADDIDRRNWNFIDSLRDKFTMVNRYSKMSINSSPPSPPLSPPSSPQQRKQVKPSIISIHHDAASGNKQNSCTRITENRAENKSEKSYAIPMRRFKSGYFTINSNVAEFLPREKTNSKNK
ncbi:hypothetical protein DOLIC_00104 [Dolichomitus sp. PSUC_FEM 10030005]|nr:hypothetical protein [Dolichomitus sp. PSUC_FEM 10030005]